MDTASTVTVSAMYRSVAGQGFQVRYDAHGNPYLGGPTVTGSGTGGWQTATATLTGAQFAEAQNLNTDLRPATTNTNQPLHVSSIIMSINGN